MSSQIPWLIAMVSTAVCLLLWFRDVRRVMRERKNTVESAASQLAVCRRKAAGGPPDAALAAVLQRSESIYRQAVDHYNDTLHKPWVFLPATLMRFRSIQQEGREAV